MNLLLTTILMIGLNDDAIAIDVGEYKQYVLWMGTHKDYSKLTSKLYSDLGDEVTHEWYPKPNAIEFPTKLYQSLNDNRPKIVIYGGGDKFYFVYPENLTENTAELFRKLWAKKDK